MSNPKWQRWLLCALAPVGGRVKKKEWSYKLRVVCYQDIFMGKKNNKGSSISLLRRKYFLNVWSNCFSKEISNVEMDVWRNFLYYLIWCRKQCEMYKNSEKNHLDIKYLDCLIFFQMRSFSGFWIHLLKL